MTSAPTRLEEAERHYARGDFKASRSAARQVLETGDASEATTTRAREILAATGVDPVAALVFVGTLGLLAFLVFRYIF